MDSELDVIYRYTCMSVKASSLGYRLSASRAEFVLRSMKNEQPFAFCTTLQEVGKQLTNLTLLKNLVNTSPRSERDPLPRGWTRRPRMQT